MRGRFFNREEYQRHVFSALVDFPGRIRTLPPAIIKPESLWSGKQIISTIVLNFTPKNKEPVTLYSSSKVKAQLFERAKPRTCLAGGVIPDRKTPSNTLMSESEVIFSKGEFLSGILDKNQYGGAQYGLVHAFYELYGGTYSGKLLSAFSKIFTNFLHTEGFSLGVRDIKVSPLADRSRRQIIEKTRGFGLRLAANGVGMEEDDDPEEETVKDKLKEFHRLSRTVPKKRAEIDRAYKDKLAPVTDEITSACMPRGLVKQFPDNNLQLMVQAGAKGSMINTIQISCLLGQIELEGEPSILTIM